MNLLKPVWKLSKNIALSMNVTLLKGNVRSQLQSLGAEQLPESLLVHSKVVGSREQVLKYLPKGGVAIEVGVAYGDFSEKIINEINPEKFIAIDAFGNLPIVSNKGNDELVDQDKSDHYNFYKARFREKIDNGSLVMLRGYSWEMLSQLEDNSIDYIYIDADHSYKSVVKDIQASKKKIKPGGIIQFNDYTCFDTAGLEPYGVYKAVNEFLIAENYEVLYLCLHKYGANDVVIRAKR